MIFTQLFCRSHLIQHYKPVDNVSSVFEILVGHFVDRLNDFGEKRVESIPWLGGLMGSDGPKSVVAQLFLEGAEDSQPANNLAVQVVTVGP